MGKIKSFSRELAPHAAWRGIELGWDVMRAAILGAAYAAWQWFTHHLDIASIVGVFVICLGLLIWKDLSSRKQTNRSSLEEDRVVALEHVAATAPERPEQPDLQLKYKVNGKRPALEFRIRSGSHATIRNIGPLVSEERYSCETPIVPLQDMIPEVEVGRSVECQLLNDTLRKTLENGGPETRDSIVVRYTDVEKCEFSRTFFVYKNADGSTIFSTEDKPLDAKDLGDLREQRALLRTAVENLTYAGRLLELIAQSEYLEMELFKTLSVTTESVVIEYSLSATFETQQTILDGADISRVNAWRQRHLLAIAYALGMFNISCRKNNCRELPPPNLKDHGLLRDMFREHREHLTEKLNSVASPYTRINYAARA